MTVGSADLNEHSLFNDSEVNVATCDDGLAREIRLAPWSEHLQGPVAEISGDPAEVIDGAWRPIAEEQAQLDPADTPTFPATRGLAPRAPSAQPDTGVLVDGLLPLISDRPTTPGLAPSSGPRDARTLVRLTALSTTVSPTNSCTSGWAGCIPRGRCCCRSTSPDVEALQNRSLGRGQHGWRRRSSWRRSAA